MAGRVQHRPPVVAEHVEVGPEEAAQLADRVPPQRAQVGAQATLERRRGPPLAVQPRDGHRAVDAQPVPRVLSMGRNAAGRS